MFEPELVSTSSKHMRLVRPHSQHCFRLTLLLLNCRDRLPTTLVGHMENHIVTVDRKPATAGRMLYGSIRMPHKLVGAKVRAIAYNLQAVTAHKDFEESLIGSQKCTTCRQALMLEAQGATSFELLLSCMRHKEGHGQLSHNNFDVALALCHGQIPLRFHLPKEDLAFPGSIRVHSHCLA